MIKQARVSSSVKFFKDFFLKKYDLEDYNDINQPVLFFGCYFNKKSDIEDLFNHRNKVIIIWTGSDTLLLYSYPDIAYMIASNPHIYSIAISNFIENKLNGFNIKYKKFPIHPKIANNFTPVSLGDSLYMYSSVKNPSFYGENYLSIIKKNFPDIKIYLTNKNTYTEEQLKNIYTKCFLGLRLTKHDGLANTVCELGLMGRNCIWNGDTPNSLSWKDETDILNHIEEQRKYNVDVNKVSEKMREYLEINKSILFLNTFFDYDYYDNSLVSIIINSYKENKNNIISSIKNIRNQNVNTQIIFSTAKGDSSIDIVKDLDIDDLVISDKSGIFYQLNNALKKVKGEWLCYSSSNDIWDKNKLRTEISKCIENDKLVCYSNFVNIDENNKEIGKRKFFSYDYNKHLKGNYVSDLSVFNYTKLKKYLPFNIKYNNYAYYDLWLRIAEGEGNVFVHNDNYTWKYVQSKNSRHITKKMDNNILEEEKKGLELLKIDHSNKIVLTVALPIYNSAIITWIALEGLCNQKNINFCWELIICEEQELNYCGEDYIYKFEDRLRKNGCIRIKYIKQQKKISLSEKWKILYDNSSKESKVFLLQSSDCYSHPNRLSIAKKKIADEKYDWVHSLKGYFYYPQRNKMLLFDITNYKKGKYITGLNMSCNRLLLQKLSNKILKSGIDSWLMKEMRRYKKKDLRIYVDKSINWKKGLDIHGYNQITSRMRFFEQPIPPYFRTDILLSSVVSKDIVYKLLGLEKRDKRIYINNDLRNNNMKKGLNIKKLDNEIILYEIKNKVPILSVGLPAYNSGQIIWLALESLISQKDFDKPWELIIVEEQLRDYLGQEKLKLYKDRLKEAGCVKVVYIALDRWIPLTHKWKMIGKYISKSSKIFLMQGADDSSSEYKFNKSYQKIVEKDYDWYQSEQCYMFHIVKQKLLHFDLTRLSKNTTTQPTGLNMALRSDFIRQLPNSDRYAGVDSWFFNEAKNINKKKLRVYSDNCEEINNNLTTHGANQISLFREKYFEKTNKLFTFTEKKIEEIIGYELRDKLLEMKDYYINRKRERLLDKVEIEKKKSLKIEFIGTVLDFQKGRKKKKKKIRIDNKIITIEK